MTGGRGSSTVAVHAKLLQAIAHDKRGFEDVHALVAELRAATSCDSGRRHRLQEALCDLHSRVAAQTSAFTVTSRWLPHLPPGTYDVGPACPICGLATDLRRHGRAEEGGRLLTLCAREGVVEDSSVDGMPVHVGPFTQSVSVGQSSQVGARITSRAIPVVAALTLEFFGEAGAGGVPVALNPGTSAEVHLSLPSNTPPGIHWVRLVVIAQLDFAYRRLPLRIES